MIIFLFGKDGAVRKRAHTYLSSLGKVTDYLYVQDVSDEEVMRLSESSSLFAEKTIVMLEDCLSSLSKETLETLKASQNIFFFDEIGETKIPEDMLSFGEHVFDAIVKKEKEEFPFALCNALKRRDKKEAWVQFLVCKKRDEAELLHGALLWQVRTIHKEIVEGKKHAYSEKEIQELHQKLVTIYHDAHNGKLSLMNGMEMVVMGV